MKPISQSQIHNKFSALQNQLFIKMIPSLQGLPNWENLPTEKRDKNYSQNLVAQHLCPRPCTTCTRLYLPCTVYGIPMHLYDLYARTHACACLSTCTRTCASVHGIPAHAVVCTVYIPHALYSLLYAVPALYLCPTIDLLYRLPRSVLATRSLCCCPLALFSFGLSKKSFSCSHCESLTLKHLVCCCVCLLLSPWLPFITLS
jgi:hypothetical protein